MKGILMSKQQIERIRVPSIEEVEGEKKRLDKRGEQRHFLAGIIGTLTVFAAAVVLCVTLFFPVLQVTGDSMEPGLREGNLILTRKTDHLKTGDICGFYYNNELLLKRVIGVPGDMVDIDAEGNVSVNGQILNEPYVLQKALGKSDVSFPLLVPEDCYFVMGDNREVSIDSRSSIIGCVNLEQLEGKVILKLWPPGRVSS